MDAFWKALLLGLASDQDAGCGLVAMVIGLIGVFFFIGLLLYTSVAG